MRRDRKLEAMDQLRRATSLPLLHPGDSDYTGLAHGYLNELSAERNG